MNERLIRQVQLFNSLPYDEIEYLAATLQPCEFPDKTILFQEGHVDNHFYILLDGQVEIIKSLGTPDEWCPGIQHSGAILGEMSLFMQDRHHTASVRALGPVRLLEMTRLDFDALLHRHPTLAYDLLALVSGRMEESENQTILDLRERNRRLTLAYEQLQAAQDELIEKAKLERELAVARTLQLSILPRRLPDLAGYEFGTIMHPAQAVGGDFYDFIKLDRDSLGIVIGDVTGKGIPASIFMSLSYSLVRAEARRSGSPLTVLRTVNRHLLDMNVVGMYVTVLYGVLNTRRGEFHYARAGHLPPVLLDCKSKPVDLQMDIGQPLGLFKNPHLDEELVSISPGSTMLLYSDGVTEAVDTQDQDYGLEHLQSALCEEHAASAQHVCDRLWERIAAFTGPTGPQDDVTLLAIKSVPV
ncbi:MAG: SpoIIE family protein phosphatase [Chloroflexi bacterium]|nr:SpoIIE family protein phosphatase [Chloroflexota bacterium]